MDDTLADAACKLPVDLCLLAFQYAALPDGWLLHIPDVPYKDFTQVIPWTWNVDAA